MSNMYIDVFMEDQDLINDKNGSSTQRSPNTGLQYFYENFDPESNEECLFGFPCNSNKTHSYDETFTNEQNAVEVRCNEMPSSCEPPTKSYLDFCIGSPVSRSLTNVVTERKICNHGKQIKKTIAKKKRKRTTFTTEQIVAMEQIFKTRPYICREERLMLTRKLQVSEKSIKVWFQNRRRISEKRENLYVPDSPSSEDTCESYTDRLAYIESHINERVDRYGNVALDDCVITELVSIIDEHLPKDTEALIRTESHINYESVSKGLEITPTPTFNMDNIMYEPISPASVLDDFLF